MRSAFAIRDAVVADADAIAAVSAASWRSSYRGVLPDDVLDAIDVGARAAKRRDILARAAGLHLVAHDDVEIVGFCDAGPHRDGVSNAGELYAIYLLDRAKRHGVGSELFRRARAWLAARGMTSMSVWVIDHNTAARQFYEALGGRAGATKQIQLSGTPVTEIAYEWTALA
jgi:GNAT superfamily N-acetyltransferase